MNPVDFNAWKESIENFVIDDVRIGLNQDMLEVGLIILTFVGIECLGGYLEGKPGATEPSKKFLRKYFPPDYSHYVDDIYLLRNGLMHDYTIKEDGRLKRDKFRLWRKIGDGVSHLQSCEPPQPYPIAFNREQFARDFLKAWESYLNDLTTDPALNLTLGMRLADSQRGFLTTNPNLYTARSAPPPPSSTIGDSATGTYVDPRLKT